MGDSYYEYYLAHHGIKGQKWGDRNGPPYPLNPEDHSAAEKKAISKSSRKNYTEGEDSKRKGLTDGQKKAITIGAAAVATGLAVYGGYKLYQSGAIQRLALKGETSFSNFSHQSPIAKVFSDAGYRKSRASEIDSFIDANPLYKPHDPTPKSNNCIACALQRCVFKLTGVSTEAKLVPDGLKSFNLSDVETAFKGTRIETLKPKNWTEISSELIKNGDGACGIIGNTRFDSANKITRHAIFWEVKDGRVVYSDNQAAYNFFTVLKEKYGSTYSDSQIRRIVFDKFSDISIADLDSSSLFNSIHDASFIRLDTATDIDWNALEFMLSLKKEK